jgi:hypothetical protein
MEPNEYPTVGGYVFWHTRGSEVVLFGPFSSTTSAWAWWEQHGRHFGVSGALTHMRAPADNHNALWGLMKEEEYL